MLERNDVMNTLYKGLGASMEKYGFSPVFPEGVKANALPLKERNQDACFIDYTGKSGKLRLLYSEGKIFLLLGETDAPDEDDKAFKKLSTSLMLLDEYDEKDTRSVLNELCDTIEDNFGKKDLAKKNHKMPATVSKSAAKSGAMNYDPLTLGSRIVGVYPFLKEAFKKNLENYGEFLPEDFFVNHGNEPILQTIRDNEPKQMKKLFNQLCDIYDNGTNETQNVIAVTILGSIHNDAVMMKNILPYLSDPMVEPVIEVNKLLEKSKSARKRLENPPKYKPKKKKSFVSSALGQ